MKSLILAVVQFTPQFGKKEDNLARMSALTENVTADIFVFPELCTTGYFFLSRDEVAAAAETAFGYSADFFRGLAKAHNAIVVAGFAESDGDKLYNSCLVTVPQVETPYVYRKTHLFYKEKLCFDPGNTGFFVIEDERRGVNIGPMICYDWRFPESARVLMLQGADMIVCPANLITDAWQLVMPARAIENKVYLALANRAGSEKRENEELTFKGKSAIYDFNGQKLKEAGTSEDEVLLSEIYPQETRDKSFNPMNDVLTDRQPHLYRQLVDDPK
jgi:predicted amidohydrolase